MQIILAAVSMLALVAPASSNSVEAVGDTAKARQASIVYLGRELDCAIDNCPKPEAAAPAAAAGKPSAIVDAYGMPTKMPTLLRGGQFAEEPGVVVAAPADKTASDAPAAGSTSSSSASSGKDAPAGQKEVK